MFLYLFLASILIAAFLALWAFVIEPSRLVVREYQIKANNWNANLSGLKIALISDVHGGSNFITAEKIRRVVEETNDQNPDLILLCGDYVSEQSNSSELNMPIADIMANLSGLNAKYGVFAVIGNHDNAYGNEAVRQAIEKVGYTVLENDARIINTEKSRFVLLGMADALTAGDWQTYSNHQIKALRGINADDLPIITFTHSPEVFPLVSTEIPFSPNVAVFIAGHTHGGQVRLPFIGAPVVPISYKQFTQGEVRENGHVYFITPGIGTSIMPVRFGVPPEISVIRLNP